MQADWVKIIFLLRDNNTETFTENIFVLFLLTLSLTILAFYLTNRFHVAVRLFSYRSQMASKHGKNKNDAHEAIADGDVLTDVLTTI